MSELTTEQVLLLNQLMYMNGSEGKNNPMDSVSMHQGETVGQWVNSIDTTQFIDSESYGSFMTGKDWKNIITAIQNDPTICNMTVATTHTDWADGGGGGLSAVFTSDATGEAVVAFRGTANGEWADNFTGGNVEVTAQQRNALEWYQETYRELGLDNYEVTVTGHSKGGNKSKFIAIMDGTVDNCLSFDGQGFSDKFMEAYKDQIAANQYKIHNHNVDSDYVNILLNDVGDTTFYKGYDLGDGGFLENHCPNTYMNFGENGEWSMTVNPDGQNPQMKALDEFLNSYLRSMPDAQRAEALEMVNALLDDAFSLNSGMSQDEVINTFLSTLTDSKYADDLAYLLAYTIKYEQENPEFADIFKDVLSQMGMDEYAEYVDVISSILNYSDDFGPIHVDFNTLFALITGAGSIAGGTMDVLAKWIPGFSWDSEWALQQLCDWIRDKTGVVLTPEQLRKLLEIVGKVSEDLDSIQIPDNRGDIRIPSRGGGGRRIVCDSAALQRLSGELNGIRDSLAQASQEVGSAAGKLMGGFVGAALFRSSIRRNAARLEQLEQSAGQLASALSELAALYQQTEERVSSAG